MCKNDGYYDGIPPGFYVRETLDGEELIPIPESRLPLTQGTWTTNEQGLTMSGATVCGTCEGGGCRDCIG